VQKSTFFALLAAVFLCAHGTVCRKFKTLRAGYKYLQSWGKSDKVIAVVKKTFRLRKVFFATTAYAAFP
jgi:hypothetical protein